MGGRNYGNNLVECQHITGCAKIAELGEPSNLSNKLYSGFVRSLPQRFEVGAEARWIKLRIKYCVQLNECLCVSVLHVPRS